MPGQTGPNSSGANLKPRYASRVKAKSGAARGGQAILKQKRDAKTEELEALKAAYRNRALAAVKNVQMERDAVLNDRMYGGPVVPPSLVQPVVGQEPDPMSFQMPSRVPPASPKQNYPEPVPPQVVPLSDKNSIPQMNSGSRNESGSASKPGMFRQMYDSFTSPRSYQPGPAEEDVMLRFFNWMQGR